MPLNRNHANSHEIWMLGTGRRTFRTIELSTLDNIPGHVAIGLGGALVPKRLVVENRYIDQHVDEIPTIRVQHKQATEMAPLQRSLRFAQH